MNKKYKQLSLDFIEKKNSKFKDKCEKCNQFSYCKGYNGQVLCEKCINEIKE